MGNFKKMGVSVFQGPLLGIKWGGWLVQETRPPPYAKQVPALQGEAELNLHVSGGGTGRKANS